MACVYCNQRIGNKMCDNTEFIIHSNDSMQCSKCGHFYRGEDNVHNYYFVNEFSKEKQEPILKRRVHTEGAKLIATLYPNPKSYIDCSKITFMFKTQENYDYRNENRIWTWFDIYLTKDEKPIVAYYFTLRDSHSQVGVKGDILLIGDELPQFTALRGGTYHTNITVPVQNPDKIVYTGATVGGISTGGFYTQSGGYHRETVTLEGSYTQRVIAKVGKHGKDNLEFRVFPAELDVYEPRNIPERILKKGSRGNCMAKEKIHSHVIKPNLENVIVFKGLEDIEFKELIFGNALSDEELYMKACALMEESNSQAKLDAAKMFGQLGEYKDSLFKKNTCEHAASQIKAIEAENSSFKDKLIGVAFFGGFILLLFLWAWITS